LIIVIAGACGSKMVERTEAAGRISGMIWYPAFVAQALLALKRRVARFSALHMICRHTVFR
jgi:hypothetical protein